MICKNCSEEYNKTMFPYCPFCMFDTRVNNEEHIIKVDESESLEVEEIKDLKGNINDSYEKDAGYKNHAINNNEIKKGFNEFDSSEVDIQLLSSISKDILRRNGINSFSQLKDYLLNNKLSDLRNMGKESESEIISALIFMKSLEELEGFINEKHNKISIEKEVEGFKSKRVEIWDVFSDNRYNLFLEYCKKNRLKYVDELKHFNFDQLIDIPGIGIGKINSIVERYNEIKDIIEFQEDIAEMNVETLLFTNISEDLKKLSIESMMVFEISLQTINILKRRNIKSINDLQNISKERLKEIIAERNINKFIEIQDYFELSIVDFFEMIMEQYLSNKNEYEVFVKRAKGLTLQEIADDKEVTRERIRQIVNKFNRKIRPFIQIIIDSYINQVKYIAMQELLDLYDNDDYDNILILSCKLNTGLEYMDFADVFVPIRSDGKTTESILLETAIEFIGDGIDLYDNMEELEVLMNDNGFPYIECGEFINLIQKYGYKLYGDYAIKGSQSYGFLCARLIAKEFPQGIKIYDSEDLEKLRSIVISQYGDIGLPKNNRTFGVRLSEYLVLCGRGEGIAIENIHVKLSVIDQIIEYIEESSESLIYYTELFARYEGILRMTSNVDNYNFLHGILKLYYPDEYDYSRDFLQKKHGKFVSGSINKRIKNFIVEQNRPVHKDKLKVKFIGISDAMLFRAISEDKELFQWGYNYYSCAQIINVDTYSKQLLHDRLALLIKENYGYCSDAMLYDAIYSEFKELMMKNEINSPTNLFYLFSYLFGNEYDYRRPHIQAKGMLDAVSTKSVALMMLGDSSEILYSEYNELATRLKWSSVTAGIVFSSIEKDYIRVSSDRYIIKENFELSQNITQKIELVLVQNMKSDILPIMNFASWDDLPNIGFEWNQFLLHSIISSMGNNLTIIETRTNDRRFERGIIVNRNSNFKEYSEIVAYILKENNMTEVSENIMISFLIINGLTYKAIPKELYNSDKIKYMDGKFIIL